MSQCHFVEHLRSGLSISNDKTILTDLSGCKHKKVYQKAVRGHHGCVNAMGIGANEQLLSSGGDDMRVFIWDIHDLILNEKPKPKSIMATEHHSNVFSTNFTPSGQKVISTGNDSNIIVHDVETGKRIIRYSAYVGTNFHINVAVYNSSVMPDTENIFIVCADNPNVNVYDLRAPVPVRTWKFESDLFSVDFHPAGRYFALGGRQRLGVIDFRKGKDIYNDALNHWIQPKGATHAKFSPTGSGLAVVRSFNTPVYIDLNRNTVSYLTDPTNEYRSRYTVKSCEFIGEDTIVTGSEQFEIFMWKLSNYREIGEEFDSLGYLPFDKVHDTYAAREVQPYTLLKGHRSIPNLLKYSPKNGILFSSGVEKIIKMWSVYSFPGSKDKPNLRTPGVKWRDRNYIPDEESEEEGVLLHFDEMEGMSPASSLVIDDDLDTDEETPDVIFHINSDSDQGSVSSGDAIPIRRIEVNPDGEMIIITAEDEEEHQNDN